MQNDSRETLACIFCQANASKEEINFSASADHTGRNNECNAGNLHNGQSLMQH